MITDTRRTVDLKDHQVATLRSLKPGDKLWFQPPGRSDWPSKRWCRVVAVDETPDGGRRLVISPEVSGVVDSVVEIPPEVSRYPPA